MGPWKSERPSARSRRLADAPAVHVRHAAAALVRALPRLRSTRAGEPETISITLPSRIAVCFTTVSCPPAEKVRSWLHCSSPSLGAVIFCEAMSIVVLPEMT